MSRAIVIVAHPDDESFYMGGTIAALAAEGVAVRVVALADGTSSRLGATRADAMRRELHFRRACDVLGVTGRRLDVFPDQQADTVPQLKINRVVEREIAEWSPVSVYTHHIGDLNVDHRKVAEAVLVATRGFTGHVYGMSPECPSRCVGAAWAPTITRDIWDVIGAKAQACLCYLDELRAYPHPRSEGAVREQHFERFMEIA